MTDIPIAPEIAIMYTMTTRYFNVTEMFRKQLRYIHTSQKHQEAKIHIYNIMIHYVKCFTARMFYNVQPNIKN